MPWYYYFLGGLCVGVALPAAWDWILKQFRGEYSCDKCGQSRPLDP